jgi:hypothetical protein
MGDGDMWRGTVGRWLERAHEANVMELECLRVHVWSRYVACIMNMRRLSDGHAFE